MKNGNSNRMRRRGFTIIELLVVISIMAVLSTLATGAALKAVKQSRNKRVDASLKALEMALMSYRAQENCWPVTLNPSGNSTTVWFHGVENAEVFKKLNESSAKGSTVYLDGSALMTRVNGKRMTLRQALSDGKTEVPVGYALPDNQSVFCAFCVEFRLLTDSVKVHRQDVRRAPYAPGDRVDGDHTCSDGNYGKLN